MVDGNADGWCELLGDTGFLINQKKIRVSFPYLEIAMLRQILAIPVGERSA